MLIFHQTSVTLSNISAQFSLSLFCAIKLCNAHKNQLGGSQSKFQFKGSAVVSFVCLCPKIHALLIYLGSNSPCDTFKCLGMCVNTKTQVSFQRTRRGRGEQGGSRMSGIFCGEDEPTTGHPGTVCAARSV